MSLVKQTNKTARQSKPEASNTFVSCIPLWAQVAKGVNGLMYLYMVTSHVVPAVRQLCGNQAVWQDNPAWIHRTGQQALKMADVWPIEKLWAIVKERLMEKKPENKKPAQLGDHQTLAGDPPRQGFLQVDYFLHP